MPSQQSGSVGISAVWERLIDLNKEILPSYIFAVLLGWLQPLEENLEILIMGLNLNPIHQVPYLPFKLIKFCPFVSIARMTSIVEQFLEYWSSSTAKQIHLYPKI